MVKSLPLLLMTMGLSLTFLPSQAATITYDFTVTPDSGPLAGNNYSGFFSYDDSTLTGIGDEFLPQSEITTINFNFEGNTYTLADALSAGVQFLDGTFLGLSYSTDIKFAFEPGLFTLSEAFFSYDIEEGAGFGDIQYTLRSGNGVTPEPSSLMALGGLALTGLIKIIKKT